MPAVGSISRVSSRTSVDLPEPESPITTKTSPGATSKRRRRGCRPRGRSSPAAPCGRAGRRRLFMILSALGPKIFQRPSTCTAGASSRGSRWAWWWAGSWCSRSSASSVVAAVAGRVERAAVAVAVVRARRPAGSGVLPADQVGRLLGDHHHGRVDVAVGDEREDRGVDDAQPLDAVHPHRGRVDDRHLVDAHRGRARGVQRGLGVGARPSRGSPRRSRPSGPGESSPSLYGAKAGWLRMSRATRIASTHSRRSVGVDR